MSGSTAFLLDQLSKEIELLNGEFKRINVVDALSDINTPFCTNCNNICDGRCYEGTKLEQSFQVMTKADAIVIASPVYFGSVSGQLKCFFDKTLKLRQERKLIGKIVPPIAVEVLDMGVRKHHKNNTRYTYDSWYEHQMAHSCMVQVILVLQHRNRLLKIKKS